ncbi:ribosome maturation factor RimP [Candidatus Latescibacterota bacterium]
MSTPSPDKEGVRERLVALLEPVVADHGAMLVDIEVLGSGTQTVRLLVHRDPGITLDACEAISREVSDLLDVEDPLAGRYRLEVTSPGLDRPLSTSNDFRRAEGRRLRVVLGSGRTVRGRLVRWDDAQIEVDQAGECIAIGRADIAKATIEAEFG